MKKNPKHSLLPSETSERPHIETPIPDNFANSITGRYFKNPIAAGMADALKNKVRSHVTSEEMEFIRDSFKTEEINIYDHLDPIGVKAVRGALGSPRAAYAAGLVRDDVRMEISPEIRNRGKILASMLVKTLDTFPPKPRAYESEYMIEARKKTYEIAGKLEGIINGHYDFLPLDDANFIHELFTKNSPDLIRQDNDDDMNSLYELALNGMIQGANPYRAAERTQSHEPTPTAAGNSISTLTSQSSAHIGDKVPHK